MRAVAALFTVMISQAALAGVRLEFQEEGDTGSQQRIALQGDKLRFDRMTRGNPDAHTVIFDGTQMITLDNRTKTFMVIDPAMLKAQMEAIKQLSPEARAKIEKATQNEGQITFRKAAGGDTVLGFSCSNYTQLRDGVERGSICAAGWKNGPVKKDELAGLIKLTKTMSATVVPAGLSRKSILFDPDEWPGFPLSTHSPEGKVDRLTNVTRGTIPDSEFQVPSGYTQKAMPTFGGGHAQ